MSTPCGGAEDEAIRKRVWKQRGRHSLARAVGDLESSSPSWKQEPPKKRQQRQNNLFHTSLQRPNKLALHLAFLVPEAHRRC